MLDRIKVVAYFDYVGFDEDVEDMIIKFGDCFSTDVPEDFVDFIPCLTEFDFESNLSSGCVALIDYGALNFVGPTGFVDHLDRFMIKTIENHPSVEFIFILTMGREYYTDEIFEFSNVSTLDRCCGIEKWREILNSKEKK